MPPLAKEKIIIAVDVPDAAAAHRLIAPLALEGCLFKIGLQLFTREGPSIVREVLDLGARVFLDLKFHDIPKTAHEAVASAIALGVHMTTIHLAGGPGMVSEAMRAASDSTTLVLGVTVLTSMDDEALRAVGIPSSTKAQVLNLAKMGHACGLRGVVASPHELPLLRAEFGKDLIIVTPGVRPIGSEANDQSRIMTPGEAIRHGADYLVIGRPITHAKCPHEAFLRIAEEMQSAEA